MRRAAIVVVIVVGAALLVVPPSRPWSVAAGLIVIAAAVVTFRSGAPAPSPARVAAEPHPQPIPKKRSETALVATVSSPETTERSMTDLQRILAGIIADERGKVVSSNGGPIVATFGTASAAVHAAQRMISNVDALGRRLDRFIALSVGIDNSIDDAARLEQLTHEKRIPVLVSAAAAAGAPALAEVESGLFSFTPVQQRLF